jgi:L-rhamnose isomerase
MMERKIEESYAYARDRFAEYGIDTQTVLRRLDAVPISIQCWQGDDVLGFETTGASLTGGIQTTGNYPGRARNAE